MEHLIRTAAGFFVLRTPLLPFEELAAWSEGLAAPSAVQGDGLEEALEADRARLRTALLEAVQRPEIREALFVASPALYRSLDHWRCDPESRKGQRTEKALVRYYQRMAGRATPFGLFSGTSTGSLGEWTRLALAGHSTYQRRSRLDLDYLGPLGAALIRDPELAPPLTGREPLLDMIEQLRPCTAAAPVVRRLDQVRQDLEALDARGVGAPIESYTDIARNLESLPCRVDPSRLFQVDLVKPGGQLELGPAVLHELACGIELVRRLMPSPQQDGLSAFRAAFLERYGEGREVPLAEAIDEESGLGFEAETPPGTGTSPLLAGLAEIVKLRGVRVHWDGRCEALLHIAERALRAGLREVELTAEDIRRLANPNPPALPRSLAVAACLAARSDEALDRGDFRLLFDQASGPPGARRLGRLCDVDPALREQVEAHLRAEEALDREVVYAEIVHLPRLGKVGNLLRRPVLRGYEIVCEGRSGAPPERQIPLSDLRVTVVDGQILLRSDRLGRTVVARLTAAHDFDRAELRVYRFLCKLQNQGTVRFVAWSWGPLAACSFLPRVRLGRLVLARARWLMTREEIEELKRARGAERFRAVQRWRTGRELPRLVSFVEGDQELPVDFDNVLSVDSFLDLPHQRTPAQLLERFPSPEELPVRGPEGRFVHELLVPFLVLDPLAPAAPAPAQLRPATSPTIRRSFPPGSEWLYAKLYTGTGTADALLREAIAPLREWALATGAADRWFFLRYADPQWHLRVRFHGDPERLRSEVLPRLTELASGLLADGRVSRLQLDTYLPEVERYGGPEGLDVAEQVFEADSEAVLGIVTGLSDEDGDARWRLALAGADRLLGDFGLDLPARLALVRQLRGPEARFMADRYRRERRRLEPLLEPARDDEGALAPGLVFLRRRSATLVPLVATARDLERQGRLGQTFERLLRSFLHLHVIRMVHAAPQAHELVLYDFLVRLYASRASRRPATARPTSGDP